MCGEDSLARETERLRRIGAASVEKAPRAHVLVPGRAGSNPRVQKRNIGGRPRKYGSNAERQRAYRQRRVSPAGETGNIVKTVLALRKVVQKMNEINTLEDENVTDKGILPTPVTNPPPYFGQGVLAAVPGCWAPWSQERFRRRTKIQQLTAERGQAGHCRCSDYGDWRSFRDSALAAGMAEDSTAAQWYLAIVKVEILIRGVGQ
jgi:hypothetical protein